MTEPVRIVIIEDEDADAALVAAYLRHSVDTHYDTARASSLAEAVPLLAAPHHCILLDLSLPDASGFELVDTVRDLAPISPIVVLTVRDDDHTGREALRHGAQDYIAKADLSPRVLCRAIGHAIERQREHVELLRIQSELAAEVSSRREAQRDAQFAHQQAAALIEQSSDLIIVLNADMTVRSASPAVTSMLGWGRDDWTGRQALGLVEPSDRPKAAAALAESGDCPDVVVRVELRLQQSDGAHADVEVAATNCLDDPAVEGTILNVRDITERKRDEERLRYQTLHDPLTGAGNRLLLSDRFQQALERRQRHDGELAVFYVDLDAFKVVNDTHGHDIGDRLLVEVANRVRQAVRPEDTVVRLGGDEFVVLAEDLPSRGEAEAIASRVKTAIAAEFRVDDITIRPRASIGLALANDTLCTADRLMSAADRAMYEHKQRTNADGGRHDLVPRAVPD